MLSAGPGFPAPNRLTRALQGPQQIQVQGAGRTVQIIQQRLFQRCAGLFEPCSTSVPAGAGPLVQELGRLFEPAVCQRLVQFVETLLEFLRQRLAHLCGALCTAADLLRPGFVKQQRALFRRIMDFGEAVTAGSDALNGLDEQIRRHGLVEKAVETAGAKSIALFRPTVCGQCDHADRKTAAGLFANLLPGTMTVHVGHVQIHQDDVEVALRASLDGLEAAAGQFQPRCARRQCRPDEIAIDFVIVDGQHGKRADIDTVAGVHGAQYTPMLQQSRTLSRFVRRLMASAVLGLVAYATSTPAALQLDLQADATRFGGLSIERIEVRHRDGTEIEVAGLAHPAFGALGDVRATCRADSGVPCGAGALTWNPSADSALEMQFERSATAFRLHADGDSEVRVRWAGSDSARLEFTALALAGVPAGLRQAVGLSMLSGWVSGMLEYAGEVMRVELGIRELGFDTPDGRFAGAGLTFDLDAVWQASRERVQIEGKWTAGELLLGPAYLPPPVNPFSVELKALQVEDSAWRIERARMSGTDVFDIGLEGRITLGEAVRIDALDVDLAHAHLQSLWRRGLDSLAAARGWGQLQPGGRLEGRMRIENDALAGLGLRVAEAAVEDGAGRLDVQGLGAWVEWDAATESMKARASWEDARLFRIPLGAGAFELGSREDGTLALLEPFRLPVLDGALVVDRLEWRDWLEADRQLDLDARLEPVDMARLTGILGWTEFGGRISGRFPGIRLAGNAFDVQGGLDIDLFDGKARIEHLSVERPFGSLPALAADVEFEALDLEQVTGAFEFGRMLGRLSGYVRNLRLLDWQPVRFDAWFETLEDSPKRRISQKAVDSISTISGGGGAALSGTLLNFFEDFPYRKAGLGCLLENNICRMHGLRETEQGGYMILEGRALPHLDIVGYKRRVDWPRLLVQIAAATSSPSTR